MTVRRLARALVWMVALVVAAVVAGCGTATVVTTSNQSPSVTMNPRVSTSPSTSTPAPASSSTPPTRQVVQPTPTAAAPVPVAPVALDPAQVVAAYFSAINGRDYSRAWALGGRNLGQSYGQFVSGFANTAQDNVTITGVTGDVVSISLVATNDDGTQQSFGGTYTVSGQEITGASVYQIQSDAGGLCGAPPNPYGYNFCGVGGRIYSPQGDICTYFSCIDNFWNEPGYMVECRDGSFSMAGGYSEACTDHNGVQQTVWSGS